MIAIGATIRDFRHRLGLTQQETADALDISVVHLSQIENGRSLPSPALQARFRELWGVDIYVMTWAERGDLSKLPPRLREAAAALKVAWQEQIEIAKAGAAES